MILVTSANGNQGKQLVPKLLAEGHAVRACVRSEGSAAHLRDLGLAEVLVGDLADPAIITRAVDGVTALYHIGPTLHPDERQIGFGMIDAAKRAGVGHFVFSSVLHAITTRLIQHEIKRDIEERLVSSGLDFTILQPANFMLPLRLKPVFDESVFRLTWSLDRRQSMIAIDDLTDVAALVLGDRQRHVAATYELAGRERLTAHDIGAILSDVIGRPIAVEYLDPETFTRIRLGGDHRPDFAHQLRLSRAIADYYSSCDFVGNANVLTWLLGRAPTDFATFTRRELATHRAR